MAKRKLSKRKVGYDNRAASDKVRSPLAVAGALRSGAGSHGDKKKYRRNPKHKGNSPE